MTEAITVKKVVTQPFFAMTCFLLVCFILPRYGGGIATMVGCAGILSVHVWSQSCGRSRRSSPHRH